MWLTTKEKIDIGKKVEVTLEGEIHTSFPGQGTAKQLKVLQMESPDTARLPAEAALKTALLQVNEWEIPAVKEIIYQNKTWIITILDVKKSPIQEKKVIVQHNHVS